MSFESLKTDQATQKFILVKLEPARFINDLLTLQTVTTYETETSFSVSRIVEQGVELTKVVGTPTTGEWSHDGTILTVNLNSAPSLSNAVIMYYNLFYTIEKFRVLGENPELPSVNLKEWEPKIKSSPKITQTIKNIKDGQLSISSSSLGIINDNADFNQYTTENDSFYNKKVQIWHVLDDVSNIQKIFEGRIIGLNIARTLVTISVVDNLDLLTTPALMGDEVTYFTNDNFTNVDPIRSGLPVRYFFGSVSRYQTLSETVTNLTDAQKVNVESLEQATCTNYTADTSITNNRSWTLGRVGAGGTTDFGFSPISVDNSDANYTRLDTDSSTVSKIHIGDTFTITGSGTYNERVYLVDRINNYVYITKNASIVNTDTIQSNEAPTIVINSTDGSRYYAIHGRDYTSSLTTLTSGNKLIKIEFVDNFEANHAGLTALEPGTHNVFFKIKPNVNNQNHADVLSEILNKTGLTLNSTSFDAAKTAFAVNAAFSIPTRDEHDYSSYYEYAQKIMESVLSYIFLNNDFEIEYKIFETPIPSTQVTNIEIIKNTVNYSVEYKDVVTSLVGYNVHYNSSEFIDLSSQTKTSNKSRYLHEIDNTKRFIHVLEDFTSKIDDHINLKSERYVAYRFLTKGLNFDSNIGDDFTLSVNDIAGNLSSTNVKILELKKKNTDTSVIASDLYNL